MKNLKVGTKIMLGFGIVIALLAIVAVLVTITNTSTIDNVSNIGFDTHLQTLGSQMSVSMQSLRAPANRMMESTDAAYFAEYLTAEATLRQSMTEIYDYIDQHEILEKFRPVIQDTEQKFNVYADAAAEMGLVSEQMVAQDAILAETGAALGGVADTIMEGQMESLDSDILALTDVAGMQRRASRIREGKNISNLIATARLAARSMVLSADGTQTESVTASMDASIEAVTKFRDESQIIANQESAQAILDALVPYREALIHFGELCLQKAELTAMMPGQVTLAQQAMDTATADIEAAMTTQINATSDTATLALWAALILAGVSLIIGIVLALYISKLISKPLIVLTAFMKKASESGDITLRAEDQAVITAMGKARDEIGQTISATAAFIQNMIDVSQTLQAIAGRDLTISPKVLSDQDVMGVSLRDMLSNLNNMFGEINNSTAQVSTGAKQIADGSQALAQGSTEQAASVEQLSSSIAEIADKTKENAAMADKAATLANTIKQNAEKGSAQMDELTGAVREINTASQNISKVIKTIEDIAFQTNILALNASVEAARAGQHGKGFAVVAEEVRNLATKSSEAAKDTGVLIANSVEKAELGARIADETASSLTEIVAGINESTVTDIAKSSEEQSLGIAQINKGIDQVAQVVQQNSATAEESAAASEEMSGQSIMLEELIAQFKLRDAGNQRLSSGGGMKKQIAMPEKTAYSPEGGDFGKY